MNLLQNQATTEAVQLAENETELSSEIPCEKNNIQSIAEETSKEVDEHLQESNTLEVVEIKELKKQQSNDVPNGKNNAESITEETPIPVGDVNEDHESMQIKESKTIPSEDYLKKRTLLTQ